MGDAAYYLTLILKRINDIRTLTEDGNPSRRSVAFNKAKCKYMAQELTTNIQPRIETSLLPAVSSDTVPGPVLRHIAFAVENAERLVKRSCERKWWKEIFWMGNGSEAFGEVLLDVQAAMEIAIDNTNQSMSRYGSELHLGQAWKWMVLQDRSVVVCNVRLLLQHKSDLATGKCLDDADLEIAKHVLERDHSDTVIHIGMVTVGKRIVKGITCIQWHGNRCVMKRFLSDEHAKREAAIMKDLVHPHVVLLLGYARHKNRLNFFSQPSPNILLEYADQGDLRDYIKNLQKDLKADVIVNVMLEIAKGMRYIHSKRIAHLDLKSMNIFVTTHASSDLQAANFVHVKIGDFGTAIRCDHDGLIPDWVYGQGTTSWRAPELFKEASRRSDIDLVKADVYSYSMVCVELVTRQLPLHDRFPNFLTSSKVYEYISVEKNRPPLPDTYPPELLSIIRGCWDGEPSKRPSFEDIVEALTTLKGEMLLKGQFYSDAPRRAAFRENKVTVWNHKRKLENSPEPPLRISGYGGRAGRGSSQFNSYGGLIGPSYGGLFGSSQYNRYGCFPEGPSQDRELDFIFKQQIPFGSSDYGEDGEDGELVKTATMCPLFVVQTIYPPFNAEGCEMLIQLGQDVRRKVDGFVAGGANIGQHMYTARASHLQRILGQFQEHLLNVDVNSFNVTLFDEVFNALKRVEFLLASCSWPAIEFHGGPTATDEAFLSLRKNLEHCLHMMRYSPSTVSTVHHITFEDVSKFVSEDLNEDSWGRACESDGQRLLQFLSSSSLGMNPSNLDRHWYLGSIAVISKDPAMFSEHPVPHRIPRFMVVESMTQILWDEGPDGLILGPVPVLPSETIYRSIMKTMYHQRPVSWAVKVSSRKLAYDFTKLASLQHPHVVQIFGAWEYLGSEYVAMKMMQTNVIQFLSQKQEKSLPTLLLLTILVQVAEGMSYMHSHHVRHHNLKGSNVLVGGIYESLEVVHVEVSDYGLEPRRPVIEEDRDSDHESSGVQFGEGDETDEYAFDVYQFALLCSELFSIRGSDGASTSTTCGKLDAVSFPAKCPGNLASFLHKCGSKDPKERPRFAEICTVLRNHKAHMILSGGHRQA